MSATADQASPEASSEHRLRCGDTVIHKPSGERWSVAYADYGTGYLSWCGWPDGEARIADCELRAACTDAQHEAAVDEWFAAGRPLRGDHRRTTVARLYRPGLLVPDAEEDVRQAEARLAGARARVRELRARIEETSQ